MATERDLTHRPHLCVVRDGDPAPEEAMAPPAGDGHGDCHCDQIPALVEALMQQRMEIARLRARLLRQLEEQEGPAR